MSMLLVYVVLTIISFWLWSQIYSFSPILFMMGYYWYWKAFILGLFGLIPDDKDFRVYLETQSQL